MILGLTQSKVIQALLKAGHPLTGAAMLLTEAFETPAQMYNALSAFAKDKQGPVERFVLAGESRYQYRLKPGADVKTLLASASDEDPRPHKIESIEESIRHINKQFEDAGKTKQPAAAQGNSLPEASIPTTKPESNQNHEAEQSSRDVERSMKSGAETGDVSGTSSTVTPASAAAPICKPVPLEKIEPPPVLLVCQGDPEATWVDPYELEIDPMLVGLVLRLPVKRGTWSKVQRYAWLRAFYAITDYLYPDTEG